MDGRARVADFGLAKMMDDPSDDRSDKREGHVLDTLTGTLIGTPAYMAPEQIVGERSTRATDVWAIGVMLHEIVGGRRPFVASELDELVADICAPTPARLSELPGGTAALIAACLDKKPSLRPTIDEVLAALERRRIPVRWAPRVLIAVSGGALALAAWYFAASRSAALVAQLGIVPATVAETAPPVSAATSAPPPAAASRALPSVGSKRGSTDSCTPKYVVGKDGVRRYKPWCF
jgi:serine/threonine protein kinase